MFPRTGRGVEVGIYGPWRAFTPDGFTAKTVVSSTTCDVGRIVGFKYGATGCVVESHQARPVCTEVIMSQYQSKSEGESLLHEF